MHRETVVVFVLAAALGLVMTGPAYSQDAGAKVKITFQEERLGEEPDPIVAEPEDTSKNNDSPNAYVARQGTKWTVMINGKPGKAYNTIDELLFSPDGKLVAFAAKAWLQIQGKPGLQHTSFFKASLVFQSGWQTLRLRRGDG